MFFSPSLRAFFDPLIHRDIPGDAVRISPARHAELLAAIAEGATLRADARGRPTVATPRIPAATLRAQAVTAVKAEARRRILAVASLDRQANDTAAIALAALAGENADAAPIERRTRIDAIRAASNEIEREIERMPTTNLKTFDPATHRLWPKD